MFLSPTRILRFFCPVILLHFIIRLRRYPVIILAFFIPTFLQYLCFADSLSGSFRIDHVAVGWTLVVYGDLWRLAPFRCLEYPCKHSNHTTDIIANLKLNSFREDREAIYGRKVFIRRIHKVVPSFHEEYLEWFCKVVDCSYVVCRIAKPTPPFHLTKSPIKSTLEWELYIAAL